MHSFPMFLNQYVDCLLLNLNIFFAKQTQTFSYNYKKVSIFITVVFLRNSRVFDNTCCIFNSCIL